MLVCLSERETCIILEGFPKKWAQIDIHFLLHCLSKGNFGAICAGLHDVEALELSQGTV